MGRMLTSSHSFGWWFRVDMKSLGILTYTLDTRMLYKNTLAIRLPNGPPGLAYVQK